MLSHRKFATQITDSEDVKKTRVLLTGLTTEVVNCLRNSARALQKCPDVDLTVVGFENSPPENFLEGVDTVLVPEDTPQKLVETVRKYCLETGVDVVFPCVEYDIPAFAKSKERFLEDGMNVICADAASVDRAVDKASLVTILEDAQLPCPKSVVLETIRDIGKLDKLGYPIVLKPTVGFGAVGVYVVDKPAGLSAVVEDALQSGVILAQEYIPGGNDSFYHTCFLFDGAGEPKLTYQSKSLKTKYEFGGPTVSGTPVREPGLLEDARKLLREIGDCFGPVCVEAKRHEHTGVFYIIDVNMRMWGYSSLAEDAGLSFPYGAVLAGAGRDFQSRSDYLSSVVMQRTETGDHSTFTFDNGKSVEICGRGVRQSVAVCLSAVGNEKLRDLCADPAIDAVVVIANSQDNPIEDRSKLYEWVVPDDLDQADAPFWVGHIFGARQIRSFQHGNWNSYEFNDLWDERWFGRKAQSRVRTHNQYATVAAR